MDDNEKVSQSKYTEYGLQEILLESSSLAPVCDSSVSMVRSSTSSPSPYQYIISGTNDIQPLQTETYRKREYDSDEDLPEFHYTNAVMLVCIGIAGFMIAYEQVIWAKAGVFVANNKTWDGIDHFIQSEARAEAVIILFWVVLGSLALLFLGSYFIQVLRSPAGIVGWFHRGIGTTRRRRPRLEDQ
ncbi:hypothetical protein BC936DRAFT_146609 [Jimgerdemannia flammicorona]|uniref:Uncharacterized protein n=1 Tax=Jimgerdemannia flammicorona TaxID=994334 RepID=A0A433D762_9FUNG|nr:hypothetical protein BC936DRAFT_146609 [Jimgerdemannia flammicorona]